MNPPHEFKVLRVRECLPDPAMIDTLVATGRSDYLDGRINLGPLSPDHARNGERAQHDNVPAVLHPDEGNLDHVVPRSRGGKDTWENLVWSSKDVNARKANRLPHDVRTSRESR